MKSPLRLWPNTFLILLALPCAAITQTNESVALNRPTLEIISFKIGTDYYPMLDSKPSITTADNPDFPRTEAEMAARRNSRRGEYSTQVENTKTRGKLRSDIKVISEAQWVNLAVKNTSTKPIKAIAWDFAFARMEDGKLALRYDVTSQIEIKSGAKKSLKQPLPPGAMRCQVITVSKDAALNNQANSFESVCGRGFNDPSQVKEKQEPVTIKRIEYADGSVWQRQ